MKKLRQIILLVLCGALLSSLTVGAARKSPIPGGIYDSEKDTWSLPNWEIISFEENKELMKIYPEDTNLFQNSRYLMPGSTGEDYVFISCDRKKMGAQEGLVYVEAVPFEDWNSINNGQTAEDNKKESDRLLQAMELEIQSYSMDIKADNLAGSQQQGMAVYRGNVAGDPDPTAGLDDFNFNGKIYLGTVKATEDLMIKLKIHAPQWLDNSYENNTGYIQWKFYFISSDIFVERPWIPGTDIPDREITPVPKPTLPKTPNGGGKQPSPSTPGIIILGDDNPLGKLPHSGMISEKSLSRQQILLLLVALGIAGCIVIDLVSDKKKAKLADGEEIDEKKEETL